MTRKHFVALARELRVVLEKAGDRKTAILTIKAVARACEECNDRFDSVRFYQACGLCISNTGVIF